ncbi:MAG: ORF6N domain-containing protein [Cytophagaceae bacterium]|nr:ORF6N domain-containing protein [Cytophagaceae bacterium]
MSEVFIIPDEAVISKIYVFREKKVMLDSDLAELYGVETRVLNQAVKRNEDRFPEDFMFTLTEQEFDQLKQQLPSSNWGGRRTLPNVFTEHGVLMLSSVLSSKKESQ